MAAPPEDLSAGAPAPDPRNRAIRDLQRALIAFGREFDLLDGVTCDCDNPDCSNRDVERMTVERLLDWVSDAWHLQAGCGHGEDDGDPAEAADHPDLVALRQRNLALVAQFVAALRRLTPETRRSVESRYERVSGTPIFAEADSLVAHGLDTRMPDWEEEPWALRALDIADEWADGWHPANGAFAEPAIRAAVCGLLARGLAAPALAATLYEPFALAVPLNELLASAGRGLPTT